MTTLDEGVTVGRLPLGVIAISVLLAAAIFAFDLSLPLGVAGGVPYVALVLVGLWSPWRPYLLLLAATAIALTILGFVLSPPGGEPWVVATNRALAVFAICAAAALVFQCRRSDEAQRESEVRYRELVESSPDAILVHTGGKIVFANAFAAELLGRQRPEDLIGIPALEIVPPDDREEIRERQRRTGESDGKVAFGEERLLALDGSTVAVEVTAVPVRFDGDPAIQLVARDITERKVAEQAVRESESQLRLLTDSLPVLVSYVDAEQRYRRVNKAYEEWFGHARDWVVGRHVREVLGEAIYEDVRVYLERALSGETVSYENTIPYKTGGFRHIQATYVPDVGVDGGVKGFFAAVTDVTALKRSEQELQDAHDNLEVQVKERTAELTKANALLREEAAQRKQIEESLRLTQFTLDHAGDMVFWIGESGRFEYMNESGTRLLGYSRDELSAMHIWDFDPDLVQANWPSTWARVVGRDSHTFEAVHVTRDGIEVPVEVTTNGVDFGERQIICSFSRDITERKRAEEALRESEATLRSFADNSPLIVVLKDIERRYVMANPHFCEIIGLAEEEVLGQTIENVFQNDFAGPETQDERKVLETGSVIEREIVLPTVQGDRPYHQVMYPVRDGSGGVIGFGVFATDITERKRADRSMRESEARLKAIVDHSPAVIALKDTEGRYVMVNRRGCELLGMTEDEVLGKTVHDLIPHEMAAVFSDHEQRVLATGEAIEQENPQVTPEGPCPYLEIKFPVLDASGTLVAIGLVATDLTERKRAEEELLVAKEQAELANRAKSEFLANMSHELRTPLNAIIGFSEIISNEMFGPVGNRKYKDYGADIRSSGVHLLSIINDLLDLSKIDAGKIEIEDRELDVERVTEAAMQMVSESVEAAGLKAELQVADRLPGLRADERGVTQILLNLLSNATKFTPKGGRITVRVEVDGEHRFVIAVSDTGIGIAEDDLPRALAPFGQLENSQIRKHDGTGLGLPLVQKLVELHGGAFELESEAGAGTTATARFPSERTVYR